MSPNLRFGLFLVAGAFFLLGPIETQVLLGPARSTKRPYLPMHWRMYQGLGVGFCQAEIYAQRDGARYAYSKEELSKALGQRARSKKRVERFVGTKKARAHDVVFSNEAELGDMIPALCTSEPGDADVRAEMRCSPPLPGGKWRLVEDGSRNLCERTKWAPSEPPLASPQPPLDPETGEVIEPPDPASEVQE